MKKRNVKKGLKRYLAAILCILLASCYFGQVTAFAADGSTENTVPEVEITGEIPTPSPQLSITKEVIGSGLFNVGDEVSFLISVLNTGSGAAQDVVVTDIVPEGLQFLSSAGNTGSYDAENKTWTWNIGTLPANMQTEGLPPASTSITFRVLNCNPITNTAVVHFTGGLTEGLSDSATIDAPDIRIQKKAVKVNGIGIDPDEADENGVIHVGDVVTYEITAANYTEANLDCIIQDDLDYGLEYVNNAVPQGTVSQTDPNTATWDVNLQAGGSITIDYDVEVNATGYLENYAMLLEEPVLVGAAVTVQGETPTQIAYDHCVIFSSPKLDITKSVDKPSVEVGNNVTFTIEVTYDRGLPPLTMSTVLQQTEIEQGIIVNDILPTGLEYVSDDSKGAYDLKTGDWIVPNDVIYDGAILHITARVTQEGEMTNTATANAYDYFWYNSSEDWIRYTDNKSASAKVTGTAVHHHENPTWPDLTVTKTADKPDFTVGDNVTYTITVKNIGDTTALNAVVNDVIPADLLYQSDNSGGSFDKATGKWTVGSLGVGEQKTLSIVVKATTAGTIVNTATTACDNTESNPTNNTSNVTITVKDKPVVIEQPTPNPPPVLPKTGGIPPEVFSYTGLIALAAGLLLKRKNK